MQLLVSVSSAVETSAALLGGADIIDAKDPLSGPLGAVTPAVFRDIYAGVAGVRPVTAAIGDASDEGVVEGLARSFVQSGAAYVKVGFAGIASAARIRDLLAAATRGAASGRAAGARSSGVIAVAYADASAAGTLPAALLLDVATRAGSNGVLLDTFDKAGPGVRTIVTAADLGRWVANAHAAALLVAVAGKLTAGDIAFVCDSGADIAGVRGAACEGGRTGFVVSDKVSTLRALCTVSPGRSPAEAAEHV